MSLASLNARTLEDAPDSGDVEIVLFKFSHPDLAQPLRLSSDNTHVISYEPPAPVYGTKSTWLTDDGSPFLHVGLGLMRPGDDAEAPPSIQMVMQNVTSKIGQMLADLAGRATADIGYFLSSDVNLPQVEYLGMRLMKYEDDPGLVILHLSYDDIGNEPHPCDRMTKDRFPGLFK